MFPFLPISGSFSRACQSFSPSSTQQASSQSNTSQDSLDAMLLAELEAYLSSLPKQPSQDTIQLSNRAKRPRLEEGSNHGIYADSQLPTRHNTPPGLTLLDFIPSSTPPKLFDTPFVSNLPPEKPYSQNESNSSDVTTTANLARKRGWAAADADDKTACSIYYKKTRANTARKRGWAAADADDKQATSIYYKIKNAQCREQKKIKAIKTILNRTLPASGQDFQGGTPWYV